MTSFGTYEEVDGRPAVVFERQLQHPVERVWRAISDFAELARWFPDLVSGDVRPGGSLRFEYAGGAFDGEVLELAEPERIRLRWGTQEVRLTLEPTDTGCVLRLVNLLDAEDEAARNASGWDACLASLDALLDGAQPDPGPDRYDEYVARGLPSGAPIPS